MITPADEVNTSQKKMQISIIGEGNVGSHLFKMLKPSYPLIKHLSARKLLKEEYPANIISDCDLCLICVRDDKIGSVAKKIADIHSSEKSLVVAHTSGCYPLKELRKIISNEEINCAVLYPLQTFTKGVEMKYTDIPFLIEGENPKIETSLISLMEGISKNVRSANTEIRKKYHLAAVISCNFTNYLFGLSDELLSDAGLDFKLLIPLIKQTFEKVEDLKPFEAMTGPARRKDYTTIDQHMDELDDYPETTEIYRKISENILKRYE